MATAAQQKAIVIGAGFSGLWHAAHLAERGYAVEVYEREAEIGGHLGTVEHDNFRMDLGPHIYFASHRHHYEKFLKQPLTPLTGYYGFAFKGRHIRSPLTPQSLFRQLPLWDAFRLSLSAVWARFVASLWARPPANVEQWCVQKHGRLPYRYFFRDYIPKVTGLPAPEVAIEWGTERERFYREHNIWKQSFAAVLKMFSRKDAGGKKLNLFHCPAGSFQIIEGMAAFVRARGGTITTGATLREVVLGSDRRVQGIRVETAGGSRDVVGDLFVNTIPIDALARCIPGAPAPVGDAAAKLKFRHLWLVYAIINRPQLTDKIQIYFPEKKYLFKRVYEIPPYKPGPQPQTALSVEICYSDGDEISRLSREELQARVRDQICEFYQVQPSDFGAMLTAHTPCAYAAYDLAHVAHLRVLAEFLLPVDNLVSCGRPALFRYNFLTDRIIDAAQRSLAYIDSGQTKQAFLGQADPKGDFI